MTSEELAERAHAFQAARDALEGRPPVVADTPDAATVRAELAAQPDHIKRLALLERYGFVVEREHYFNRTLFDAEIEPFLASDAFREGYTARAAKDRDERMTRLAWDVCRQTKSGAVLMEPTLAAATIHDELHTLSFNRTLYVYHEGIYRENAGEVEALIKALADTAGCRESLTKNTREVLHHLTYLNPVREYPFNCQPDLIPVANGVIRLDYTTGTVALLEHSPDFRFTFKLPVVYDPAATPAKAEALFSQYVLPEDVPLLFQILAQALLQSQIDKAYKKAYLLQGERNAGKTTYTVIADGFFGGKSISHVSLQQIATDKFCTAKMEGRLLNIFDDLSAVPVDDAGMFKALTGGTRHGIEAKFKQGWEGRIFAVQMFTCNRPPKVPDDAKTDAAFWERWEYVTFPFSFSVDPDFFAKTLTPAFYSSLLAGVLKMMIEIRQRGGLTVNRSATEVMQRWTVMADPLYQFIEEKMDRLQATLTDFDKDKLWGAYLDWCDELQVDPRRRLSSMAAFTRGLVGCGIVSLETSTTRKDGTGRIKYDVYRGPYRWKNADEHMGVELWFGAPE